MKELFEKQDREFEEKFKCYCDLCLEDGDLQTGHGDNFNYGKVKSHISQIRQETLEAVKELVERKNTPEMYEDPEVYKDPDGKKYVILMEVKQHNQALDDIIKALDIKELCVNKEQKNK